MDEVTVVKVLQHEVRLDPAKLQFDERTLSDYLEKEAGYYDYFGARLADAEYVMQRLEMQHDLLYADKFKEYKEAGATDKMAEYSAKSFDKVEQAKVEYLKAKRDVRLLQQHLRAWDRAHENAQSRGHFLRKEMDKLSGTIHGGKMDNYLERQIAETVGSVDVGDLDKLFGGPSP